MTKTRTRRRRVGKSQNTKDQVMHPRSWKKANSKSLVPDVLCSHSRKFFSFFSLSAWDRFVYTLPSLASKMQQVEEQTRPSPSFRSPNSCLRFTLLLIKVLYKIALNKNKAGKQCLPQTRYDVTRHSRQTNWYPPLTQNQKNKNSNRKRKGGKQVVVVYPHVSLISCSYAILFAPKSNREIFRHPAFRKDREGTRRGESSHLPSLLFLYSSWMSSRPRSSSLSRVRTFFMVLLLPLRELRFEPRDRPVPLLCLECAASSAAARLPVRGEEEELEWCSCLPPPERRRRMTRPPSLSELLSSS